MVKKALHPVESVGCFGKKKEKKEEEKLLNNFCLLSIDLFSGKTKVVIDQFVDVAETYNTEVFYILAERKLVKKEPAGCSAAKKAQDLASLGEEKKNYDTKLMMCNLVTGENKPVLNESCEIQAVVNKKIVYSTWKPNSLNIDIRVYDINNDTDVLIEENVKDFYGIFDNKIFYTIGNDEYAPKPSSPANKDDKAKESFLKDSIMQLKWKVFNAFQ